MTFGSAIDYTMLVNPYPGQKSNTSRRKL